MNAVCLTATGVNNDGHREVLGGRVATSETGTAWNEFFADLVARGHDTGTNPEEPKQLTTTQHT